jgi:hypothetical protein
MSSYLSEKLPKWLIWPIVIFFGLFLVCLVVGFLFYDIPQFFESLLVELAGIFLSFAIALLFVDNLVEHYRKQQWAKVRDYTFTDIASHLKAFVYEIPYFFTSNGFGLTGISPISPANTHQEVAVNFQVLADELRKIVDKRDPGLNDVTVKYYEAAQWDLDQIQMILTPRVIQSQAEQELVDVLIEFDQTRRHLQYMIIGHKLILSREAFPALISLVEVSGKLYSTLCKYWKVD